MAHSFPQFEKGYTPSRYHVGARRALALAAVATLAILLLLPFTQLLSEWTKKDRTVRSFEIATPPPPPPPPLEEPPEPPPQEEPPPDLQPPPPPLDLAQLEMALNPGIGDATAGGLGFGGFAVQPDAASEVQLFDVRDLDEIPRPVRQVAMQVPSRFKRERISGTVVLEIQIDEQGRTTVLRVVETSSPELNENAIKAAEQFRWTAPTKNGEPVKARYELPIGFRF